MELISNYKEAYKFWSVKLTVLAGILIMLGQYAEEVKTLLPVMQAVPTWVFTVLSFISLAGSMAGRIMKQQGISLPDGFDTNGLNDDKIAEAFVPTKVSSLEENDVDFTAESTEIEDDEIPPDEKDMS